MMKEIDDSSQKAIIEKQTGAALVLAGPGCGKTHILARRIFYANTVAGVPFAEMLCVTFTNRAAREMNKRIESYLNGKPDGLFVGNIHRFCLHFLYRNELLDPDTSILDEEDLHDFLASTFGLHKAAEVRDFTEKVAFLYQSANNHPAWIMRRPRTTLGKDDTKRAEIYARFKAENKLVDFDEIILRTYTALAQGKPSELKMANYRWVQVDEVQDMTPLQLAIIELLCSSPERTALFLGDEQQAIFNFIGAGGRALDVIKRMCAGNTVHLSRNYRSPRYLVNMCNSIASSWLDIDPTLLPDAVSDATLHDPLLCFNASPANLRMLSASLARRLLAEQPSEDVMILVRTNAEGDNISYILEKAGIEHFHISKQDIFHRVAFKTVWSHLAVLNFPMQWHAWARLLYQTASVPTLGEARKLVVTMRDNAVSPAELLSPGKPCTLSRFVQTAGDSERTIIVVDTETTGLDIFNDDIVQLAAVKMRGTEVIESSRFEVFISSDKPIMPELAPGVPNPVYGIYATVDKQSPEQAFAAFIEYAGADPVFAGHNIEFDAAIIANNIARRTRLAIPQGLGHEVEKIDTLAISRLLFPRLKSHRLGYMLEKLKISGVNSHNALDDVAATASLLKTLLPLAGRKKNDAERLLGDKKTRRVSERFSRCYGNFYCECRSNLFANGGSLAGAVAEAHDFFVKVGAINRIQHFDYLIELINNNIADSTTEHNLRAQLSKHLYDLLTYNESDLFATGIVKERLSVMTVHKAKGLEADNVIIADASAPLITSIDDHARLLYVAFSRARRRLAVGMSKAPDMVLQSVLNHFRPLSRREIAVAVNSEALNLDTVSII